MDETAVVDSVSEQTGLAEDGTTQHMNTSAARVKTKTHADSPENITTENASDKEGPERAGHGLDKPAPTADSEPASTACPGPGEDHEDEHVPANDNHIDEEDPEVNPRIEESPPGDIFEVHDSKEGVPVRDHEATKQVDPTSPEQEEANDEEEETPPDMEAPEQEEPTSPEQEEPNDEEEEETPAIEEEGSDLLQQLQAEREEAIVNNSRLQERVMEHLLRNKWDDIQQEEEKLVSEREDLSKYQALVGDLWRRTEDLETCLQLTSDLRLQLSQKLDQAEQERRALVAAEHKVAVATLGKQLTQDTVGQTADVEQHQDQDGVRVRLKNVKLRNQIRTLEATFHAKERLADGTSLTDCEQLVTEKEELQEKIEKRDDEVLKLRKKIGGTVEVLTHVKEKLHWSQLENQSRRAQLAEVDALVAAKRDVLTRAKQARDDLRTSTLRLKKRRGLLENHHLLWDFQDKEDAIHALEDGLGELKERYAENRLKHAGNTREAGPGKAGTS